MHAANDRPDRSLAIRFSEDWIRSVREANDLVSFVSEHVQLKKQGKDFRGLCPFHADHSPSMYVSGAKQIYKCFACGAAGNVITFAQKLNKLTFPEALELLAERAGIDVPERTGERHGPAPADLAKVNEWAMDYFHHILLSHPAAERIRAYVDERGLNDQTVTAFRLGYAMPAWDALLIAARQRGIAADLLLQAGLVKERPNGTGLYDSFRDRLMFPIVDATGRVAGFGGRRMSDEEESPKYLNTGETPLFEKGRLVFGLTHARDEAARQDRVIVVEGYTDVCMAHQHGVSNAVATLGTALTEHQVRLLRRFAREIVVVYDGDAAGNKAADKALDVGLACGGDIHVAALPDGLDPCDLLVRHGRAPFDQALAQKQDALVFLWRKVEATLKPTTTYEQRNQAVRRFIASVIKASAHRLIDPVQRGFMVNHLYAITGLKLEALQAEIAQATRSSDANRARTFADARRAAYEDLLAIVLAEPALLPECAGEIQLDELAEFRLFFSWKLLLDWHDLGEPAEIARLLDAVGHEPTQRWLIDLQVRMEKPEADEQTVLVELRERLGRVLAALHGVRQEQQLASATQGLRRAMAASDDQLARIQELARRPDRRRSGPIVGAT